MRCVWLRYRFPFVVNIKFWLINQEELVCRIYMKAIANHNTWFFETMVYACLFCGETFSLQWNLTRHAHTVHSNHNHECEQCGEILNRKDNYQRHLRSCQRLLTCTYSDGKKIQDICGATTSCYQKSQEIISMREMYSRINYFEVSRSTQV